MVFKKSLTIKLINCYVLNVLDIAKNSLLAYQEAFDIAQKQLPSTHPVRLGLVLNFSVYYFEIQRNTEKACELANQVT